MKRGGFEMRFCNECDWVGPLDETCMLGSIGPLCPECRETTDTADSPFPLPNGTQFDPREPWELPTKE